MIFFLAYPRSVGFKNNLNILTALHKLGTPFFSEGDKKCVIAHYLHTKHSPVRKN